MMNDKKIVEFVNPYNFVPLGQMKDKLNIEDVYGSRSNKDSDKELLSGYLDVSMYVKTPLIVPDAAHKKEEKVYDIRGNEIKHTKYNFFKVKDENGKDKYIIPGSTLRGSIRSMYEAVTNSCFPFLMDDKISSYRLPLYMHLSKRGLLHYENGCWVLYAAKVNLKEEAKSKWVDKTDKQGNKIIKRGEIQKKLIFIPPKEMPGTYIEGKGYLQYNEPIDVGKYHIVYLEKKKVNDGKGNWVDKKVKVWEDSDDIHAPDKELLSAMMRDGVSGGQGKGTKYQKHIVDLLQTVKENEDVYIPVYYLDVEANNEKIVYLSNASIGRIGQHRKWKDIVGEFSPCEDTSKLCPACMLFGTVNGKGMKGHIRFTDAVPVRKPEIKSYTLDILGKPRHSAYEFYLVQPPEEIGKKIDYWNYDFRGTGAERKGEDCKYEYYTPTIRGRKMYWHSIKQKETSQKLELNATMEGVKAGSEFSFKIYFDEITQKQLDDLIWVISLGENKESSNLQYKIGHGKPLGFGSVKLVVNNQTIREVGDDLRVNTTVTDIKNSTTSRLADDSDISLDSETVKALLKMANAETTEELLVSYPISLDKYGKEDTRVFSWFSENHKNGRNLVSLPYPTQQKITLPAGHQKSGGNNKYKGSKFKGRF